MENKSRNLSKKKYGQLTQFAFNAIAPWVVRNILDRIPWEDLGQWCTDALEKIMSFFF
jgi:hypothetical protein